MVIDESSKVIFLHNPKCGGTFFRNSYLNCHGSDKAHDYWKLYDEIVHTDLGHINLRNLPRFVPDFMDYKIITFVRNPYNRFVSALKTAAELVPDISEIGRKCQWNIEDICNYISTLNYREQDFLLRNPCIPWLNPQSYFIAPHVITLQFESYNDWNFLLNVFRITDANIYIREDYKLNDYTKGLIYDLYFDDENIFKIYK